ncbi:CLUMA_CG018492, isoform A [Clunio marinus]|uniref:CLUMA_CG018492, isoform A n=1 Tax=Clunio marinus TaxID=568069 RepID=A0A1J1J0A0_9DIPT|nr:CLUMA_CG018492, isoform A [Clunio marinus]
MIRYMNNNDIALPMPFGVNEKSVQRKDFYLEAMERNCIKNEGFSKRNLTRLEVDSLEELNISIKNQNNQHV